jgi:hypothetical protein
LEKGIEMRGLAKKDGKGIYGKTVFAEVEEKFMRLML